MVEDELINETKKKEIKGIESSKRVDGSVMKELQETILEECQHVLNSHSKKETAEYNDPIKYSALVREMLDTKKMAISKVKLLYREAVTEFSSSEVLEQPLRTAYRSLVSKMLQEIEKKEEHLKEIEKKEENLLEKSDQKSARDLQRKSALEICKLKGFVETDVNDVNELQEKSLATFAADGWSTEDMKLLIMAGANVNSTDRLFQTPLYVAAQYGHVEIIEFLGKKCKSQHFY